jgi:AraC-like DNA-binding protein
VAALAGRVEHLAPEQRAYALDAILGLLGVLSVGAHDSVAARRFARALADISAQVSDPELSADAIASMQGVSRRRLESIFAERGTTIGAVIWNQRLERIASTLADRTQDARRLIDVALSWGFNSEAHFSRSFRRKFGESPRSYRRRLSARPVAARFPASSSWEPTA